MLNLFQNFEFINNWSYSFALLMTNNMFRKIIVIILALTMLHGCATVPVTGRKQLSLVSSGEINQMAAQQYREVIAKGPLSNNAEQTQLVKRVGVRIQKAVEKYMADKGASSQLAGFNWEFNLIQDDKTVNAWCMPGGKGGFLYRYSSDL